MRALRRPGGSGVSGRAARCWGVSVRPGAWSWALAALAGPGSLGRRWVVSLALSSPARSAWPFGLEKKINCMSVVGWVVYPAAS